MLGEKCIDFNKNRIKCFANMQRTRIKVFGEKRLKKGFAKEVCDLGTARVPLTDDLRRRSKFPPLVLTVR